VSPSLPLPPRPRNPDGGLRRIGVELEMHGLTVNELAEVVADHVGGTVETISRYEARVVGDEAGPWGIEFDYQYLKDKGRERREIDGVWKTLDEIAEDLIRAGTETILPMEVVSPPLPLDRLDSLDALIARLRDAGAEGTRDFLTNAFGTHLNPELPSLDAETVTSYFKAFLCLFEWLRERARVDFSRRLSPFIEPFDIAYVRRVVDPNYWPAIEVLIDDYLDANPSRNRVLDMLPLFAHLDEDRVRAVVDDPRIKARPTLHYRLPNCEIDEPGWGIGTLWRDWLEVERLAADAPRLQRLCRAYAQHLAQPVDRFLGDWKAELEPWLTPPDDR